MTKQTRRKFTPEFKAKVEFIPAVKDLNPEDKIMFRFHSQIEEWTNLDVKSSRNEENPFI